MTAEASSLRFEVTITRKGTEEPQVHDVRLAELRIDISDTVAWELYRECVDAVSRPALADEAMRT